MRVCWINPIIALILSLTVLSCSVKEDRSGCPCLLTVDLSDPLDTKLVPSSAWSHDFVLAVFSSDSKFLKFKIRHEDATPEYDCTVRKGELLVTGLLGLDESKLSGSVLKYPEGKEADALYVYWEEMLCLGETARAVAKMNKQYSNISIKEDDTSGQFREEASLSKSVLVANSNSGGLDLDGCKPVIGRYRCTLRLDEDGFFNFRMPRQPDHGISVNVCTSKGEVKDVIPLGKYLDDCGYGWDDESLKDVVILIDRCTATVSVSVEGWRESVKISVAL